jgi:3-oxoacyl-[acyl-carrier-protein] synthase II
MLAGGAEAPINRQSLAGLCGIHALSTRNDEPPRASRPFDALRDGFVLAEGAGILVLERLSYARQRGASIYAEVAGYASICDAYHPIHPHPQGHGAARTMRRALMRAGIGPQQVDYIQAYASGLPDGDIGETLAIKRVFGEYATAVPVSAMKSMTGHLLSAAGGVEAAAALLGLTRDTIPPTINQEEADPACDLDYVPNAARTSSIQTVLANAYGFGGIYASLVFRHLDHAYE